VVTTCKLQRRFVVALKPTSNANTQTCRQSYNILSELPEARYNVLLYRYGMEDGPNTRLPVAERLKALEAYGRDRLNLSFSEHTFPFSPGTSGPYVARGMVCSWDERDGKIRAYRLACPQRGVTFKQWVIQVDGELEMIRVNSPMNLLLIVRRDDDNSWVRFDK